MNFFLSLREEEIGKRWKNLTKWAHAKKKKIHKTLNEIYSFPDSLTSKIRILNNTYHINKTKRKN